MWGSSGLQSEDVERGGSVSSTSIPIGGVPPQPPPPALSIDQENAGAVATSIKELLPSMDVAHWTHHEGALNPGLTVCAQPRGILAREMCHRVRENRWMQVTDKTVGQQIVRD